MNPVAAAALLGALFGAGAPARAAVGDVVITEIMAQPSCASEPAAEWFELYNATATTIDLDAWRVGGPGETDTLAGVMVDGFERVVICADADTAMNGGVLCDAEWSSISLDGLDRIGVRDTDGNTVDEVSWSGGPWPLFDGASMALREDLLDGGANDEPGSWCASQAPIPDGCGDLGSPGAANSDADSDEDGTCDGVDSCIDRDGDGAGVGVFEICGPDNDDGDANVCNDSDGDGCDDCAMGTDDPANDGLDSDGDGICDVADGCSGNELTGDDDFDGWCNDVDTDDDGDGYGDDVEVDCGSSPTLAESVPADADSDGTCDALDPATCGNGAVEAPEECDDHNVAGGDGCSGSCLSEAVAGVPGAVVITELMINPGCSSSEQGEWLELTNTSGAAIGLVGWKLQDGNGAIFTIDTSVDLPSGGRAVACADDNTAVNGGVACDLEWTALRLGEPVGSIALMDGDDTVIDAVAWDGAAGWTVSNGRALALAPGVDATDNDSAANWCPASGAIPGGCGDTGSPGVDNGDEDLDADGLCDAGDLCMDIDGDGTGDPTWPDSVCQDDDDDGDPFSCNDSDADGCDDCSSGVDDPLDDGTDSDADGTCDSADLCNGADASGNADGDADCNDLDDDDDGDGWTDAEEIECGTGPVDAGSVPVDSDGDGVCDAVQLGPDSDGDGYTDAVEEDCGTSANNAGSHPNDADLDGQTDCDGDCNDADAEIYTGATEVPYDNRDQDCDGFDLTDVDGDGYDDPQAGGTDCDDGNADVHPFTDEVCDDGIDNDCDSKQDAVDSDCADGSGGTGGDSGCNCAVADPTGAQGAGGVALLAGLIGLGRIRRRRT